MADRTGIEWTRGDDGSPGATWNPVTGCDEVSPGCDHCYAKTFAERWRGTPGHYFEAEFDVQRRPDKLDLPLRWRRPRRVFVNSMSDLFHKDVSDEYIARVFAVMAAAPQHTFQILTKRHGRMRAFLRDECRCGSGHPAGAHLASAMSWAATPHNPNYVPGLTTEAVRAGSQGMTFARPLPNVWLGVSVEDQQRADLRIPALLDTPAAVRWLSCEPLLGPVDLSAWMPPGRTNWQCGGCRRFYAGEHRETCPGCSRVGYWSGSHTGNRHPNAQPIDWVVVGGESGPKARPMHPEWARSLRDQCVSAGVPFLFKQWGEWGPAPWVVRVCDPAVGWKGTAEELAAAKAAAEARGATHVYASWADQYGHELYEPPHKPWSLERVEPLDAHQAPMRRWGKKRAGRELDGRTWDEYPPASATRSADD